MKRAATLADLMERMGHASTRAAVRYTHTRDSRQRLLAQAMSEHLVDGLSAEGGHNGGLLIASGTRRARGWYSVTEKTKPRSETCL